MKKGKAILFSAFTCLALFSCVACSTNAKGNSSTGAGNTNTPSDTEKPSNSTVPEYKGMTISQNSSRRVVNEKNVFKAHIGTDNEAIDGEESATSEVPEYDDHEEKEDTIEENIEDLVSIDVETDDEVKYYVQPKETFTVEIHLSNPNQYEIQSFTLNGKKYSNYMFKDGSTMELLLLETTAPSTPGYYEYTIDAIKYIDGTEIKDVKMSGDKTIKTGIEYSSAPTASISSLNISTTYVDMGIDVTDTYSLIGKNELFVYLSDGENIIDKKSLKVGNNEITFDNLEAHTLYEYGVITAFDLVDGQDLHSEWLLTDTFTTESIYSLSSIESTNTSISFKVDKNGEAGQIDSISLYDNSNGRLVASGNSSTRSFGGLLSNHTYKLYVDFSYTINDTKIADWVGEDITTIAKVEPKIEILDISADQTSVTYRINTEDVDNVCEIKEVSLIKNGEVVESQLGTGNGSFTGLLSNNTYNIEVSYSYDLNDGNGPIDSKATKSFTTTAKTEPKIEILEISADKTSVSYRISTEDADDVCEIKEVNLIKNGEIVDSQLGSGSGSFTGLLSNNTYNIEVSYSYDLNDGNGPIDSKVTKSFTTIAKTEPKIEILDISADKTSVSYRINTEDVDDVCEIKEVTLIKNGEAVDSQLGSGSGRFTGLLSNNTYNIEVSYSYDLNDGNGPIDSKVIKSFTTIAKFEPQIKIVDFSSDKTSVSYKINMVDNDGIGKIDKVELVKDGTVVSTNNGNLEGTFNNLLSGNNYEIKAFYSYDLNDGEGIKVNSISQSISTIAKIVPEVNISDFSSDQTSIDYQLDMSDEDEICTIEKVELLKNGEAVDSNDGSTSGSFDNLLSDNTYSLKVTYSYDLNDGNGIVYSFIEKNINTLSKNKPSIGIDTKLVTDSSISADILFDDADSVGMINSVTLYNGDEVVAINSSKEVNFNDLDYYTDYKVVISYSYDLNDGKGMIEEVYEKEFKTSPYINFKSCNIINTSAVSEGETIYMQVSLDNPSGAIPESVVVNGQKYNCASSTSQNKIYVEIINNGQFEGGNTELIIQKVNMKLDGKIYSVEPKNNNSDSVFINGILSVESLELVNSNNEIVYYAFPKDEMKLLLTLKNKTGYSIDGSSLGERIKIDNNHYYKNVTLENGRNYYDLTSISYSNDSLSKTLNIGYCSSNRVYKVNSNSIVEINSLSGLQNTTFNGGYYKLTSDIDLSKTEWTNLGSFHGILDGNGYSIKNMTNVSTVTDKDINIGLFKDASGLFLNCKLEDVTIMMTLNSTTPDEYFASFGGFVSGTHFSDKIDASFINCEVTGDISINNTTSGETYVGGLVGYEYPYPPYLYIDNCRTNININIKKGNKTSGVGAGLVGYFAWANCKIFVYNSYVEGSINASSAQVINGTTPSSTYIVDYKNNRCNVLLNGVKTTSISDLYIYGD